MTGSTVHITFPARSRARRAVARLTALALVLTLMGISAAPASADPIADKRAQAAAVQKQVDALNTQAEIASENYNNASAKYASLDSQVHSTEQQISQLKKRQSKLQSQLDKRANVLYRQGPLGLFPVLLNSRSFSDFDATWQMLVNLGHQDAQTVTALKLAKTEADAAHTRLVAARAGAAQQRTAMAANKAAVNKHLGDQKTLLAGINSDIRTLIAQQQAAEAAAAARRAAEVLAAQRVSYSTTSGHPSRSSGGSSSSDSGGAPPPSGKGAAAVYWAEKELGKPYVWAAAGPDSFDCSGLTMWAYRHVGVSLPHYSGAQIDCGSRVSRSNLQPGDLVFFGSPIHHVGMYVGHGDFIEAPHSGANVRISSLSYRDDYAGACRP